MARLVSWPLGLKARSREPLTGPRAINATSTQTIGGYVQTTAAGFGLWRWRFQFPPLRGQMFRRYRGWITSMHGGANATRVEWKEWDRLTFAQRGIITTNDEWKRGQPWSTSVPWEEGQNWGTGDPLVRVYPASLGASDIYLYSEFWGNNLDVGDMFGFAPNHFGWYMVTERIDAGHYRIWPPLDKALAVDDYATLSPSMAARLESEDAANAPRGTSNEGPTVTLVQVKNEYIATHFSD